MYRNKMVRIAKDTKKGPKYSKPNTINEIDANTSSTNTSNDVTSMHIDLSDLELSSDIMMYDLRKHLLKLFKCISVTDRRLLKHNNGKKHFQPMVYCFLNRAEMAAIIFFYCYVFIQFT